MAEALEQQGNEAFVDEDFTRALDLYTQAVALAPSSSSVLISRAQAQIKLGHFRDALADANKAIELNPNLAKAYLRKGIALFSLEDYRNAKAAFEQGAAVENNSSFQSWITKCNDKLDTMEVVPEPSSSDAPMNPVSEPSPSRPSPPKYRHEWYQSQTEVVVTIFAKGVKPEDAHIEFGEQMLSVIINAINEDPYVLQTRLFGKVVVPQCRYSVLSTKLEIRLRKGEEIRWNALEFEKRRAVVEKAAVVKELPQVPSSSKKKDWDRLEAEIKKEDKDEKLEGDAALNKLFREIYANADEDTRRAMNKSFVESNGTVLSTNWSEVGTKKVEGSAPQGMEMKKWEI